VKNARQRAICLIELGNMLERNGMTVCEQIGASKAMSAIATQVSDRDNSVRSAALDVLVIAFNIVGEDVYKLMGNISEKNTSLIQERVKRTARRENAPANELDAPAPPATAPASGREARPVSKKARPATSGGRSALNQEFSLDLDGLDLPPTQELVSGCRAVDCCVGRRDCDALMREAPAKLIFRAHIVQLKRVPHSRSVASIPCQAMPDLAPTALDAEAVQAEPKVVVPLAPVEQAGQLEARPVPAASMGKRASIPSVR